LQIAVTLPQRIRGAGPGQTTSRSRDKGQPGTNGALTGTAYTPESLKDCGRRIYALERRMNNFQGRDRTYDAYVAPKLKVPLSRGAHQGRAVDEAFYNSVLDAYYAAWGWSGDGRVQ
jgi:aldehyde:ferredoxin oxidoreductase